MLDSWFHTTASGGLFKYIEVTKIESNPHQTHPTRPTPAIETMLCFVVSAMLINTYIHVLVVEPIFILMGSLTSLNSELVIESCLLNH